MRFTISPTFWDHKTTWLAIAATGGAVIGVWQHALDPSTAWTTIVFAWAACFVRDGIAKGPANGA